MTPISVQAFTPILGTLLLSPNAMVSGPARCAVVDLLCRIRKADDAQEPASINLESADSSYALFGRMQRQMFEEELIHQLVIGIGRLDAPAEDDEVAEIWYDAAARTPAGELPDARHCALNSPRGDQGSYFPHPTSHESPTSSPISTTSDGFLFVPSFQLTPDVSYGEPSPFPDMSFRSDYVGKLHMNAEPHLPNGLPQPDHHSACKENDEANEDLDPGEQAAVGRLSSMSLIAAVAAGGMSYMRHCSSLINHCLAVRFASAR